MPSSHRYSFRSRAPGARVFWTAMVTLVLLLGLAFYLVVGHQVRKAEARRTAAQVQQTAFSDCLQYVVGSTIGSCISRLGVQQPGNQAGSAGRDETVRMATR